MAMTIESEREAFEKWVSKQPWFIACLGLSMTHDAYVDPCINSRWQGWQAARGTQPAQAVDVGAIREVIAALRTWRDEGTDSMARKLTRALAGEKAGGWTIDKSNADRWLITYTPPTDGEG